MFSISGAPSRALPFAAMVAALSILAGCSTTADVPIEVEQTPTAAESIVVTDGWVKAVDEGMTAAFGVLENVSDVDVTLVSASATVSPMIELHEVVMNDGAMVMQQKQGGITIAAGSTHELAPGHDHIMLMGVVVALMPGDEVMITLEFADGSTLVQSFTVKEFAGAEEDYVGDMHDHGDD